MDVAIVAEDFFRGRQEGFFPPDNAQFDLEEMPRPLWASEPKAKDRGEYVELIAYCVLKDRYGRVWAYERKRGSTEKRLQGDVSIGVGGNVERQDRRRADGLLDVFKQAAYREVEEEVEVNLTPSKTPQLEGILYMPGSLEDEPPCSADHVGIVYTLGPFREVSVREEDTLGPLGWWDVSSAEQMLIRPGEHIVGEMLEDWSQELLLYI